MESSTPTISQESTQETLKSLDAVQKYARNYRKGWRRTKTEILKEGMYHVKPVVKTQNQRKAVIRNHFLEIYTAAKSAGLVGVADSESLKQDLKRVTDNNYENLLDRCIAFADSTFDCASEEHERLSESKQETNRPGLVDQELFGSQNHPSMYGAGSAYGSGRSDLQYMTPLTSPDYPVPSVGVYQSSPNYQNHPYGSISTNDPVSDYGMIQQAPTSHYDQSLYPNTADMYRDPSSGIVEPPIDPTTGLPFQWGYHSDPTAYFPHQEHPPEF